MLGDPVTTLCARCFRNCCILSLRQMGEGHQSSFLPSWMAGTLLIVVWLGTAPCSTAMIYGKDDRQHQTYHDMYHLKSVGIVIAGSYVGVGTLAMRGDVMVTSAHVVYDELGQLRSHQVSFFPDGDPKKKVVVDLTQSHAGNILVRPGQLQDDWIILRLTRDVLADNTNQGFNSVRILLVTSLNFDQLRDNIVHVSFDFRRRPVRKLVNRKCQFYRKERGDMFWGIPSILLHDCDLGRRDNSGSPIFYSDGGVYYLVGLHEGSHKDFYGSAFNPRINPNFAFGVNDEFKKAINEFLGTRNIVVPVDQKPSCID